MCCRDSVPGLLSFDPVTGSLVPGGRRPARALCTLTAPAPAPRARVALASPRLTVPQQLHALVAALPALVDAGSGLLAPP